MKKLFAGMAGILMLLASGCGEDKSIDMTFPSRFEGKEAVIAAYDDSTVYMKGLVENGRLRFDSLDEEIPSQPALMQLMIDGRTRGIFVMEPGGVRMDSTMSWSGTEMNRRLSELMNRVDSIEEADPDNFLPKLREMYEKEKNEIISLPLAVEIARYSSPEEIRGLISAGGYGVKDSHRIRTYLGASELRAGTSSGSTFKDFSAVQPDGEEVSLSDYAGHGKWTLVDFWASWCPYCIKDLPALKDVYKAYESKGLIIVGVAVRDTIPDTQKAVKNHGIEWPVIYNAGTVPYALYGITGIPHLMLIDPAGKIVSRGESVEKIASRLAEIYK